MAAWHAARHVAAAADACHARCSTAAWPSVSLAQLTCVFSSVMAARRANLLATFAPNSPPH
eukprot:2555826-Prymnesium_polylepis.1